MDRSVGNAWPTTRTASRLGCRWPRRGRDGTIQSRLRQEGGFRTSLIPEREPRDARSGGCGFELAILNQGNTPAHKAPPPPDLASLPQMELANQSRFNCGSLLGCEPAQGWARATRWVSFPRVMTLVVLASPPRLPIENSEEPFSRSLRCFQGVTEAGPCGPVRGLGEATYTGALRSWGSGLSVTHCFGSDPSKTPTAFVSRSLHSLFLPFSFCPEQIALTT